MSEKITDSKPEDQAMYLAFGSTKPRLAEFPHCIVKANETNLRTIAETFGSKIGVWGNCRPLVDAKGDPYLEPDEGGVLEDFPLWLLPANQIEAFRVGPFKNLGAFTMTIDAKSPVEALRRMSERSKDKTQFDYWEYIDLLPEFLNELNWAYVPLEGEMGLAMLATSDVWSEHLQRAIASLKANKELAIPLRKTGNTFTLQCEWLESLNKRSS